MGVPNKQIGWSQESNLLHSISKLLEKLGGIIANNSGGGGGIVDSVVGGSNITVDNTDPNNPVINSTALNSVVAGANISIDYTDPLNPVINSTADNIIVVTNYSALPAPNTVPDTFYWVSNTQGTKWLPGTLGGTFYNKGMYYSNGTTWEYIDVPYQATQADVNAGVITDQFVTPSTLNGWATSGPGGQTAFFTWKYSTNTAAADPGNGNFRGNNISAASVTKLYIDDITSGNQVDISNLFGRVKGKWLLHIQQRNDASKWMQFTTSLPYTDNTGWWTLDVTFQQEGGGGSLTNLTDCLFTFVNQNDTPSAEGGTGCLTFASPGLSIASATTINIGAVTGWVVDNETNPGTSNQMYVNYAGESGKTVPTIGSGLISYILLSSSGVISFQNTLPTSAQRKTHIWLGKVSHPNLTSLAFINNEPDYILSPQGKVNDLFQVLGPYINDGVIAYPNGANLTINITAGNLYGNGINFVNDNTIPNEVNTGPFSPLSFVPRTQTGAGGPLTTLVDPGNYDVGGVVTAIPGGGARSTIRYIYAVPGVGFVIQYGQTFYSNMVEAIANIGRETQVIYPNLLGNAILIGVLVCRKDATVLNNPAQAKFFQADKLGQIVGSTAGIATGTLQTAYNNSVDPEILTDSTRDGFTVRRGSASDTDNVYVGQDGAGNITFSVNGLGQMTLANVFAAASTAGTHLSRNGNQVVQGNVITNITYDETTGVLTLLDVSSTIGTIDNKCFRAENFNDTITITYDNTGLGIGLNQFGEGRYNLSGMSLFPGIKPIITVSPQLEGTTGPLPMSWHFDWDNYPISIQIYFFDAINNPTDANFTLKLEL